MLLINAHIQHFRGLKDITLELSSLTLLIGENNSGKTSILDAIRLALSRGIGRRAAAFDPYDYHLPSKSAEPQDADPISITLTFAETPGEARR